MRCLRALATFREVAALCRGFFLFAAGERSWWKARERRAFVARFFEESSMRHRYRNRSYDTVLPFVDTVACATGEGEGDPLLLADPSRGDWNATRLCNAFSGHKSTNRFDPPILSIRFPVNAFRLPRHSSYCAVIWRKILGRWKDIHRGCNIKYWIKKYCYKSKKWFIKKNYFFYVKTNMIFDLKNIIM